MAENEHEHGSMDVTEQEKMFAGFMRLTVYALVIIFIALAFLALTQT
ncbi:MAG: aa3-type cytochrome c oxidase subunit IV [Pseudomonadota bacterium]